MPDTSDSTPSPHERPPGWAMLVHLLVLWSFAVVQPTLSAVSNGIAFFFPIRRVDGLLFLVTMVAVAAVPPLLMWLAGLAAGRGRPEWRWKVHVASVGLLIALFAATVARELRLGLAASLLLIAAAGAVLTLAYMRREGLRSFLTVLAPAPVVFLVAFLGFSDASHLLTSDEPDVPAGRAERPVPVVVYVLDELPIVSLMDERGRIDRSRFPNTARFADDATWYRNTLSPAWTTTEAVPAILTGRRPVTGRVPINVDHPENLFTLLRDEYDESVIESYTRLCPLAVCPNQSPTLQRAVSLVSALSLTYLTVAAPRVVERRLPNPGNTWSAVLAALDPHRRIDPDDFETGDLRLFPGPQFDRFTSSVRRPGRGDRPPLYFLHASLPHSPYVYVPDGRVYRDHNKEAPGFDVPSDQWENNGGAVQAGWQRHLLQTQFADRTLGRLMRRLKWEGLYDDALVVVVADHGASFIPGSNRRRPRAENLSDISMVPFFVKPPGRGAGRIVDRPVSTLDVVPAITRILGMPIPWRVDGRDPSVARGGERRRFSFLGPSDRIPLDPAALRRQRRITLRGKTVLFGSGSGGPGYYGLGPARAFQGKPLPRSSLGPSLKGGVSLRDSGEFGRVDLDGPFVPAMVRGTVRSLDRSVLSLAVAVNGRIMGSGYPIGSGEKRSFEVMVDPAAFRQGDNRVEVLGVTQGARGVRLHRLT